MRIERAKDYSDNNRLLKICYLADLPSIHTQNCLRFFSDRGHEISVITFRDGSFRKGKVYYMKSVIPRRIRYLLKVGQMRRLIVGEKPDVLLAQFLTSYGFLGALTGFKPFVAWTQGSDVLLSPQRSPILKQFAKFALKKADMVISPASHVTERLVDLGCKKENIITLQYGVDTKVFFPDRESGSKRNFSVISTRTLKRVYNVDLLVRGIPYVIERLPNTDFVIIGEGSRRKSLQKLAFSLKVAKYVSFLGRVSQREFTSRLRNSDVYVSTSLSDGASLSLLEAMACGVFPVVTDIPANKEWIRSGQNGFLVPVDNPKVLGDCIVQVLQDDKLRDTARAKNLSIIHERGQSRNNLLKIEKKIMELVSQYEGR